MLCTNCVAYELVSQTQIYVFFRVTIYSLRIVQCINLKIAIVHCESIRSILFILQKNCHGNAASVSDGFSVVFYENMSLGKLSWLFGLHRLLVFMLRLLCCAAIRPSTNMNAMAIVNTIWMSLLKGGKRRQKGSQMKRDGTRGPREMTRKTFKTLFLISNLFHISSSSSLMSCPWLASPCRSPVEAA